MKKKLITLTKKTLNQHLKPHLSELYNPHLSLIPIDEVDGNFITSDGRSIPIYKRYRYNLNQTWKMFGPLSALNGLGQRSLLDYDDKKFIELAKGYRTIESPLPDIRERLDPYLERHSDLFISKNIPDLGHRIFKPSKSEVETLIERRISEHEKLIAKVSGILNRTFDQSSRILEVGYTSGGESIIAFERLGFDAYGIDYNYDGTFETNNRHKIVSKIASSNAIFLQGDITKKTSIKENFIDFIHTQSVLEHIQDIPAAFKEMHRILKPGGVMFHHYDPYFHSVGGHPPCILDSPWAHIRLNDEDIKKYIEIHRPNEADAVIPWIKSALNRKHTQRYVQHTLIENGFNIYWWQNRIVPQELQNQITPDILSDCLKINPNIDISDLLSYSVSFIALKI